ncbi:MAG: NADH-quinone oxidoreductase subunit B family protein, partial [Thiomonas sp.]
LVTGPVSRHMELALRRTYDAMPEPKLVVAAGDCAAGCGVHSSGYAVCGRVAEVLPVDVTIPGCPPSPQDLLQGILRAVRRRA